ncbi:UNVERIFIED_CONTAM: hypothetical protein FKN15_052555 [Acipenser sinensis]
MNLLLKYLVATVLLMLEDQVQHVQREAQQEDSPVTSKDGLPRESKRSRSDKVKYTQILQRIFKAQFTVH